MSLKIPDIKKVLSELELHTSSEHDFWGVEGGFKPFLISSFFIQKQNPSTIVVCSSYREMEEMYTDLGFYLGFEKVRKFPNWESLPYDEISPEKSTVAERLRTLADAARKSELIIVTTVQAYFNKILPPSDVPNLFLTLKIGGEYSQEELIKKLRSFGYNRVEQVEESGEYSIRGDIIDIYVAGEENPYRIDFFDEEIERVRVFDSETQESLKEEIDEITIVSCHEIFYDQKKVKKAQDFLNVNRKDIDPLIYTNVRTNMAEGELFTGIESIQPILYDHLTFLNEHFAETPIVVFCGKDQCRLIHQEVYDEIIQELELALKQKKVIPDLERFFYLPKSKKPHPENAGVINIHSAYIEKGDEKSSFEFPTVDNQNFSKEFLSLENAMWTPSLKNLNGIKMLYEKKTPVWVSTENESNFNSVKKFFEDQQIGYSIVENMSHVFSSMQYVENDLPKIIKGQASKGFRFLDDENNTSFCLITSNDIYGVDRRQSKKGRKKTLKGILDSMDKIEEGDFVVHEDYGIGIFQGINKINLQDESEEFLVVGYRNNDKIYLPVDKAYLLSKYSGVSGGKPVLNSLNDKSWEKTKKRATKKVQDIAEDLIRLYAARKALSGISFSSNQELLKEFEMKFPFVETEDQIKTIEEVLEDMESTSPMDRLVCGDVGFGKTEVALRASCKAVLDGYQVAVLVPTTVLASQHFETFSERFSFLPINIRILNRLNGTKEAKKIVSQLSEGKIDLIIGTHRILSKDVVFKKLGLLIVDEEQRFGVKDKEKIRQMKNNVDTLTLTATPIPRTLHMSLMGIRDISIINTPPNDRRSIKTRVMKNNKHVIIEAIEREKRRNGQVIYIHNRIDDIHRVKEDLQVLLPHISMGVVHGRMQPKELEKVMLEFFHNEFTILISTTIVESGLDITNANTLIVDMADRFGLAQLYQIRGRVGRSNKQAYAYFMIAGEDNISQTALKRLNVLKELTELGSGFKIASHDLEIRGAGNMLGAEQSGEIDGVGINLYISMIEDAVHKIKGEIDLRRMSNKIKITSDFPAFIPEKYIESTSIRMEIYQNLSEKLQQEDLEGYKKNLEDRFGLLPFETSNLLEITHLKMKAAELNIQELKIGSREVSLRFIEKFSPDLDRLLELLSNNNGKLRPDNSIMFELPLETPLESMTLLSKLKDVIPTESV